jgi:hypothetical protein
MNADSYGDTLAGETRQGYEDPDSMSNSHDTLRREAVWLPTGSYRCRRRSEAMFKSRNAPLPGPPREVRVPINLALTIAALECYRCPISTKGAQ